MITFADILELIERGILVPYASYNSEMERAELHFEFGREVLSALEEHKMEIYIHLREQDGAKRPVW